MKHLQAGRISRLRPGLRDLTLLKAHHEAPRSNFVVRWKPEGNNAAPVEVLVEFDAGDRQAALDPGLLWIRGHVFESHG